MAEPIYMFFKGKFTEAWHQLSKGEQDKLFAKIAATLEQVGGKSILICNSAWASAEPQFWGVEEYPNIEAVQQHAQLEFELNWERYVDSWTVLGTKL